MTPPSSGAAPPLAPDAARDLLERARAARTNAYAPYSRFAVGAALLARDGRIFSGVNVENASYGLTICAERTAVVTAVAAGVREFSALAVVGPAQAGPCTPCGSCRQVLHEFAPDLQVVTEDGQGDPVVASLRELLPHAFDAGGVRRGRQQP